MRACVLDVCLRVHKDVCATVCVRARARALSRLCQLSLSLSLSLSRARSLSAFWMTFGMFLVNLES
jgi:hypothetical protein